MVIEIPITAAGSNSYDQRTGLLRVEMDAGVFRMAITLEGERADTIEVGWAELTEALAALNRVNNHTQELLQT